MSGGSYNYAYHSIDDLADSIREKGCCSCASPVIRRAFAEHLRKVSAACRAIEWNDSCDGDDREEELIMECISKTDIHSEAVVEIKNGINFLQDALRKLESEQ